MPPATKSLGSPQHCRFGGGRATATSLLDRATCHHSPGLTLPLQSGLEEDVDTATCHWTVPPATKSLGSPQHCRFGGGRATATSLLDRATCHHSPGLTLPLQSGLEEDVATATCHWTVPPATKSLGSPQHCRFGGGRCHCHLPLDRATCHQVPGLTSALQVWRRTLPLPPATGPCHLPPSPWAHLSTAGLEEDVATATCHWTVPPATKSPGLTSALQVWRRTLPLPPATGPCHLPPSPWAHLSTAGLEEAVPLTPVCWIVPPATTALDLPCHCNQVWRRPCHCHQSAGSCHLPPQPWTYPATAIRFGGGRCHCHLPLDRATCHQVPGLTSALQVWRRTLPLPPATGPCHLPPSPWAHLSTAGLEEAVPLPPVCWIVPPATTAVDLPCHCNQVWRRPCHCHQSAGSCHLPPQPWTYPATAIRFGGGRATATSLLDRATCHHSPGLTLPLQSGLEEDVATATCHWTVPPATKSLGSPQHCRSAFIGNQDQTSQGGTHCARQHSEGKQGRPRHRTGRVLSRPHTPRPAPAPTPGLKFHPCGPNSPLWQGSPLWSTRPPPPPRTSPPYTSEQTPLTAASCSKTQANPSPAAQLPLQPRNRPANGSTVQ